MLSYLPVNSLKEVGIDLCCVVQAISVFFDRYKPGSTMIDLALWFLQDHHGKQNFYFNTLDAGVVFST